MKEVKKPKVAVQNKDAVILDLQQTIKGLEERVDMWRQAYTELESLILPNARRRVSLYENEKEKPVPALVAIIAGRERAEAESNTLREEVGHLRTLLSQAIGIDFPSPEITSPETSGLQFFCDLCQAMRVGPHAHSRKI